MRFLFSLVFRRALRVDPLGAAAPQTPQGIFEEMKMVAAGIAEVLVYSPPERAVETSVWTPYEPVGWALMSDVGSARAGVPEALIEWRRLRCEAPPKPMI